MALCLTFVAANEPYLHARDIDYEVMKRDAYAEAYAEAYADASDDIWARSIYDDELFVRDLYARAPPIHIHSDDTATHTPTSQAGMWADTSLTPKPNPPGPKSSRHHRRSAIKSYDRR